MINSFNIYLTVILFDTQFVFEILQASELKSSTYRVWNHDASESV